MLLHRRTLRLWSLIWLLPWRNASPVMFCWCVLVLVALFWRVINPDVLVNMGPAGWAYLALSSSFAVLVGILGWFGAKMTFPH